MEDVRRRVAQARRAISTLVAVLDEPKTSVVRDAAIQRFEYSFEAIWKATQRYLRDREGLEAASPAAAIRSAHGVGLLSDQHARLALEIDE